LAKGDDAEAVLRAFVRDQNRVLRLWIDDVAAQAVERLSVKYPGQDLSRVAESIVNRLTVAGLNRETIGQTVPQTRSRGVRI
jgi:hypothetical protein